MTMYTFRWILAVSLVWSGAFFAYYLHTHPAPPPPAAKPKPLTDWKKFYDRLQSEDYSVAVTVGIKPENDSVDYQVFLVDGDLWYPVGRGGFRGCGRPMESYYGIHSLTEAKRKIRKQPSDDAKFVAVGPCKMEVIEVRFMYFGRKGREDEED